MSNIRADLESIKERFSDEVFLSNKGLSNEVGIRSLFIALFLTFSITLH